MKNTEDIFERAQALFNTGIGFANKILANAYIQRLKAFLPKPVKIMMAIRKSYEKNGLDAGIQEIATDLFNKTVLLGDFIKAYYKGDYREVDTIKVILIFSAIIYLATPIDLIPNWIAFIGLFDDIVVVIWLIETLNIELDKFKTWQERQAVVVQSN
jgi:uncharacterized membrane protein YkvA (DUF1232 family)